MENIRIFTPPNDWDNSDPVKLGCEPVKVFLAGTIENGESVDWQKTLIESLSKEESTYPLSIYNPRRENWNKDAKKGEIDEQIKWELHHLERSDLIIMNILGNSKSPISLLELGLFARQHKLIVFCPPTFYRFDNVRIVCERYGIPLYETNDILVMINQIVKAIK